MSARLTSFNMQIIELAEGSRDSRKDKAANDYSAACAIKDWLNNKDSRCDLAQAYTYLANARLSEKALRELEK